MAVAGWAFSEGMTAHVGRRTNSPYIRHRCPGRSRSDELHRKDPPGELMTFFSLMIHNLLSRKARSLGLALSVAIAVMAVVTLDVTSSGLEQSAAAIISVGKADFTVVQKGVSDTLSSAIDEGQLATLRQNARGVERGGCTGRDPAHQRQQPRLHRDRDQSGRSRTFRREGRGRVGLRSDGNQPGHAGMEGGRQPWDRGR